MPEFETIIRVGVEALAPGGRFVVLDFKLPSNRLSRFAPLLVVATRPFGVSLDLADRHPWDAMQRHLGHVYIDEVYEGFAYIAASEKRRSDGMNRSFAGRVSASERGVDSPANADDPPKLVTDTTLSNTSA